MVRVETSLMRDEVAALTRMAQQLGVDRAVVIRNVIRCGVAPYTRMMQEVFDNIQNSLINPGNIMAADKPASGCKGKCLSDAAGQGLCKKGECRSGGQPWWP